MIGIVLRLVQSYLVPEAGVPTAATTPDDAPASATPAGLEKEGETL